MFVEYDYGKHLLTLQKLDGTLEGISVSKMIGIKSSTSHTGEVKAAFRRAVRQARCVTDKTIHHEGKYFFQIMEDFLKDRSLNVNDIELVHQRHGPKYLADKALRDAWLKYHDEHAEIVEIDVHEHEALHVARGDGSRINDIKGIHNKKRLHKRRCKSNSKPTM